MADAARPPLVRKLGIREGHRVRLHRAPERFDLGVPTSTASEDGPWDVALAFVHTLEELDDALALRSCMVEDGGLWIAWPKKASRVPTELDREIVRAAGLATGWVDNKVCAVDEVYSGLRFVMRLVDRSG